jgi:hypothetical protein
MRWAESMVYMGEKKNAYRVWWEKPERMRLFARSRSR